MGASVKPHRARWQEDYATFCSSSLLSSLPMVLVATTMELTMEITMVPMAPTMERTMQIMELLATILFNTLLFRQAQSSTTLSTAAEPFNRGLSAPVSAFSQRLIRSSTAFHKDRRTWLNLLPLIPS